MNECYAHSRSNPDRSDWQKLDEHLQSVALLAEGFASVFGAGQWGRMAGLLHDIGKFQPAFQGYLVRTACQDFHGNSGVDHSTPGAKLAAGASLLGRLLAYCIAGHHGGLPDGDGNSMSTLKARLQKDMPASIPDSPHSAAGFPESLPFTPSPERFGFQISFFTRMIFSCLVDADFLDTEEFMDSGRAAGRQGWAPLSELSGRFFPTLEAMSEQARIERDSDVNRIRREVLRQCLQAAELSPGLFSLTVPTGGSKTLSSLAFGLRHAQRHGKRRLIYVIPYMSVIEQNADVFRRFLDPDGLGDAVLEHHSSFDFEKSREDATEDATTARTKLAAENWDASVIATTAVQFFESLFASRTSKCRKLHNISGSVVILDEAQMLPRDLLLPCLEALRELALNYGATIVLCTATQPALEKRDGFPGLEPGAVREMVHDPVALHHALRRVRIEQAGTLTDEELVERLAVEVQALCIVNTRGDARRLFEKLRTRVRSDGVFHLSANMCPEHRTRKISDIKAALSAGQACRVVSTQLVEAGVDLDFPVVFRASAGLDSIAQAAGRCDREGRLTSRLGSPGGKVFIFTPETGVPPGHFRLVADKGAEVMGLHPDPLSPEAVEHYFRLLFWQAGPDLDREHILALLSETARRGDFPFREVAERFRIIKDGQQAIIVPQDEEATRLADSLGFAEHAGGILRRLQRHTVQVHPRVLSSLIAGGAVEIVAEKYAVLRNTDIYRDDLGLCPYDPTFREVENLIL